ncbi:LacI family DNA-binding transcriptional regulator [Micromonospora sp. MS34]|uniref:LacI family DNA-binding transcriptional regulator n=1 Tax=Micromonospora sp. MS34 TaxID=3385971 RepID=UPI0039A16DFE
MTVNNTRKVTIAAIADLAGVSVPTVSRVVNGRSDVAVHTRERVEELLTRHGYRRRAAPARASSGLIDLVFNDLDSPWAVEIIRGVEDVAHAAGVGAVVSAIHRRSSSAREWLDGLRQRGTEGVIFVNSMVVSPLRAGLRRLNIPVVLVDADGVPQPDTSTIGAANWEGGLRATEYLLGLGHRRIGFISGPPHLMCSRARMDGYRAALDAAGLPVDDALVHQGDFYHESGFAAGTRLLGLADPPTAIFAGCDQMALGVYEAVRRRGLRVGDDVSVVGFDDLPEVRWCSPPLTTVRQPLAEMGMLAARTVLRLAQGEPVESRRIELATELVVRDSARPPRDR